LGDGPPKGERHVTTKQQAIVDAIKAWAIANYEKSFGASSLVECFSDEELATEFQSLADAKRYAKLQSEMYSNAQC
jgi:hypothetical protein